MSDFELLAQASGCRIYQTKDLILLKEQPVQWVPTSLFVILLMSAIPFIFGVVSLFSDLQIVQNSNRVSIVFIAFGIIFGIIYLLLRRYSKKVNAQPLSEFTTICSFDLNNQSLLDSEGNKLDSLENVSIERQYQLTSSSKKLVLRYSAGSLLIAKGNPFAGGTVPLESIFRKLGLMN